MIAKITTDKDEAFETLKKVLENADFQMDGNIVSSHEETREINGRKIKVIDKIEFHSVSIVPKQT